MGTNNYSFLKMISAILFAGSIGALFLPFVKIISGLENTVAKGLNFLSNLFGAGDVIPDTVGTDFYTGFDLIKGLFSSGGANVSVSLMVVMIAIVAVAAVGIVFGFLPALNKLALKLMPFFGIAEAALLMIVVALLNNDLKVGDDGLLGSLLNSLADATGLGNSMEVQYGFWIVFGASVAAAVVAFLALKAYGDAELYGESGDGEASIIGVSGMYKGVTFPLDSDEELIIGRDAMLSHIVITENAEKVSRKHITVSFDSYDNVYTVTDHSSNGTYLTDGTRLVANIPVKLQRGTIVYLAKKENTFELG